MAKLGWGAQLLRREWTASFLTEILLGSAQHLQPDQPWSNPFKPRRVFTHPRTQLADPWKGAVRTAVESSPSILLGDEAQVRQIPLAIKQNQTHGFVQVHRSILPRLHERAPYQRRPWSMVEFRRMGLETVEILMDLEGFFQLKIPDSLASSCVTVAELQAVIVRLLVEHGASDDEETRKRVWAGIITVLWGGGYNVAKIRPDSKWIGDITAYG